MMRCYGKQNLIWSSTFENRILFYFNSFLNCAISILTAIAHKIKVITDHGVITDHEFTIILVQYCDTSKQILLVIVDRDVVMK